MPYIKRLIYKVDRLNRKEVLCKLITNVIEEHKEEENEISRIYDAILQESINISNDKERAFDLKEYIDSGGKFEDERETNLKSFLVIDYNLLNSISSIYSKNYIVINIVISSLISSLIFWFYGR